MARDAGNSGLKSFLAAHVPVDVSAAFASGDQFGDWHVTAFLGRGGSGEVYRVVHNTLGTAAALKVCVRRAGRDSARDEAACARFRYEAELLAKNKHPAFPRFFGYGEREERPWYVMELLEHRPLPSTEREIAHFLLALASGVRHLHARDIIHRDIKPGNILWRMGEPSSATVALTEPVLIDLGLVKDLSAVRGHAGESLSIVDGKAVGVGTPRYAAPEQMTGDDVSPATDVYALGMLANDCFGGKPPWAWRRIIQRTTAAVPAQRYTTVDAFVRAIKFLRVRYWICGVLGIVLAVAVILLGAFAHNGGDSATSRTTVVDPTAVATPEKEIHESEQSVWQSLCRTITTNLVTWRSEMRCREVTWGRMQGSPTSLSYVVHWAETNKTDVTVVNLGGRTIAFNEPINLALGREYWINGPGILDAQFSASSTATVRIANCIFRNRTKKAPYGAGINYVLNGGAYLNFMELPDTESMRMLARLRIRNDQMSEGRKWWRIKGPEGITELMIEEVSSPAYSAMMETN